MPKTSNTTDDSSPWYRDGLRFECTGCGDCCTGSPGYVWVNQEEINELAAALDITPQAFEKKFVRQIGIRRSLKERPKSFDCVLFDADTRKCLVYDARPRQCRTWPFWHSTTRTPEAWSETCQACPGSGKGKLYQLEQIQEQVSVVRV